MAVSPTNSFVVSWLTLGGGGNNAGTAESILADSPAVAVTFGSKFQPNNYAGHALAHSSGLAPGISTFSFNTSLTDILCLAAEFMAADAPVAASPYATWASTHAPSGGPADDFDGDGVPNAIEFILGGGKDSHDLNKLPVVATDGPEMTFTFIRDQASAVPSVEVTIKVGTDPGNWPGSYAAPDAATAGPPVAVVKNTPAGFDTVTLTLPRASDVRKFARLEVLVTP
jgi:hypothetical protein